jgi:mitochondrial fission protein ELM1
VKILNSSFLKHNENFQIITSSQQNLYPDILKIADYIIVTSDSVNMISETATLSSPLFVSYLSKEDGKISSFLQNLEELGVLKRFEGKLFNYKKNKLNTNKETILKVNKFLGL